MNISGLEKLTLTDYPGYVACIVFLQGCNLNCPYCHNSSLIPFEKGCMSEDEIFTYLEKRKNILDGVVITGGEPLLQKRIQDFIRKIKAMGFKIKLDTNGTNPNLLKELLKKDLIDYVAMDIKHDENNYESIMGKNKGTYSTIKETIKLLESAKIDYEFRTTIVKEFHSLVAIENICQLLDTKSKYYLQNYVDSTRVLTKGLHGFSADELQKIATTLKGKYSNLKIRGI